MVDQPKPDNRFPEPASRLIGEAQEVLRIEAEGILGLIDRLDSAFEQAVELIYRSEGRVIISGIGKSGIVARKIVATLNSTGTRSLFLHPVEAMHGDLGQVGPDDIFLALSHSGETDELNLLIPRIRGEGCKVIAFTGAPDSALAQLSDIVINVGVEREACSLGLAPTASTSAAMAMGDALAVVLINKRHFKSSDFQRFHPGGNLGQRLSRRVADIMLTGERVPVVSANSLLKSAIALIDRFKLGATLVSDGQQHLMGIITDGDIRRMLVRSIPIDATRVAAVMTSNPHSMQPDSPAYDALHLMELKQITVLPIVDADRQIQGILHLHDILGKGQFRFNGV